MKENSSTCSLSIGSITQAMRAQSVLGSAAIPTTVIKYDSARAGNRGCIYGLAFACSQKRNIETVLSQERIRVKQWNGGS